MTENEQIPSDNGADVNENQGNENEEGEFKVSKEEFNKLKELERNKSIALKKEREEAAAKNSELEELRKYKKELEEKDMKKKGQYEELITEKDTKLTEYESELTELRKLKDAIDAQTTEKIDSLIESIPEEEKEFVNTVLEGKDRATQVKLLEKFIEKFKKPTFKDENEDNKGVPPSDSKSGDLDSVIGSIFKDFI